MLDYPCRLPRVLAEGQPAAQALLRGGEAHPELRGEVLFYPFQEGALLLVRAVGLPDGFLGLHLHSNGACPTGGDVPFHCAGDHYDPEGRSHPDHAGDLPVLLACGGRAYAIFYTGRFTPRQALGRSVVLQAGPDDYRSQPGGGGGNRIACGVVKAL